MNWAIGIDLGGTRIKTALVNEDGEYRNEKSFPTKSTEDYEVLIAQLTEIVNLYRTEAKTGVQGVGIGVAGLMNENNKQILTSPNIDVLTGKFLPYDLFANSKIETYMENDANAMAIGEGVGGAAKGGKYYIAITLGTGVGGAVIHEGELLTGFEGGGGELGHIPISFDGPECGCGNYGCLEAYIGTAGIRRYVAQNYPELNETSIKRINEMAVEGNEKAQKVFEWIGRTLAVGLTGLVNVFNPEKIIIGGGISAAGDLLFDPLDEELRKRAFKSYTKNMEILPAKLGNWAGVVGMGKIALRKVKE